MSTGGPERAGTQTQRAALTAGARAALPVVVGYLPVGATFGALAIGYGLPLWLTVAFSLIIYAGGTQFILLGALHSGTPWPWVVALCALIDVRHLVYGPLLANLFPRRVAARLGLGFLLTDEVFGTALHRRREPSSAALTLWLAGAALAAYATWVGSTALGAFVGRGLQASVPGAMEVMQFALPALFVALTLENCSRRTAAPTLAATLAALVTLLSTHNDGATIFAAVGAAVAVAWLQGRRPCR